MKAKGVKHENLSLETEYFITGFKCRSVMKKSKQVCSRKKKRKKTTFEKTGVDWTLRKKKNQT